MASQPLQLKIFGAKKQFYLLNPGIGLLVHRMYQRVALLMFLHIRIHPVTFPASNIAKGTTDPKVEYSHQCNNYKTSYYSNLYS